MPKNLRSTPFLVCAVAFMLSLGASSVRGQASRDLVLEVSVATSNSVPHLTLSWPAPSSSSTTAPVTLWRRVKGQATWGTSVSLPAGTLTYADTTALPGVMYEYSIQAVRTVTPTIAYGSVAAGHNLPLVDSRGKILLLVDQTMSTPLEPELLMLENNLVADGWMIVRQNVPREQIPITSVAGTDYATRTSERTAVRQIVQNTYNTAPGDDWSLLIIGRVPVVYTGNAGADGHGTRAWPTDSFYGDVNGAWSDSTVNSVTWGEPGYRNVPGDGKFDQSILPSDVELKTGRVDLADMANVPAGLSETDLLRQYLVRNHRFRRGLAPFDNVARKLFIDDHFGYFGGEAFSSSGLRAGINFFGRSASHIIWGNWFDTLPNSAYLLAYACGGGGYRSVGDVGTSYDFAQKDSKAVFTLLFGSYFGSWDNPDNILRAPLAGTVNSLGLTSIWSGRGYAHLQHMALGETIGYGIRFSQNQALPTTAGGWPQNHHHRSISMNLMGDPTLRLHSMRAPSHVLASSSACGVLLTWTESPDATAGYHVYRGSSPSGPFTRLTGVAASGTDPTGSPIPLPAYLDGNAVPGQNYTYLVKAVRMETTPSGTYANQSLGASVSTSHTIDGSALPPAAPDSLVVVAAGPGSYSLSWSDNSTDETSFVVERRDLASGQWTTVATLPANTTAYTDNTAPIGRISHYRLRAANSTGTSAFSDIAADYNAPGRATTRVTWFTADASAPGLTTTMDRIDGTLGNVSATASVYSVFNPPLANGTLEAWGTPAGTPPRAAPTSWTAVGTLPRIAPPLGANSTTSAWLSSGDSQMLPAIPAQPSRFLFGVTLAASDPGSSANRSFHVALSSTNTTGAFVPILALRTVRGSSAGWLSLQTFSGSWQTIASDIVRASVYNDATNTFTQLHPLALNLNVDWNAAVYSVSYGAPGATPTTITGLQLFQTTPNGINGTKLTRINFATNVSQSGYAIDDVFVTPLDAPSVFVPNDTLLSWPHGDQSLRTLPIPTTVSATPRLTDVIAVSLINPANGLTVGYPATTYVLLRDGSAQTLPAPWTSQTLGAIVVDDGYAEHAAGSFGITFRGGEIGNASDSMRFIYRQITGDFDFKTRLYLNAIMAPSPAAGLIVRTSLQPGAAMDALLMSSPTTLLRLKRSTDNGTAALQKVNYANYSKPCWLRVVRTGANLQTYYSADGVAWTEFDVPRALGATSTPLYVGMAATSNTPPSIGIELGTYARFGETSLHSPPAVPTGLTVTPSGTGKLDLAWNDSSAATAYRIERKGPSEAGFTSLDEVTGNTFTDLGLMIGATYTYRVYALNPAYTSAASVSVSATVSSAYEIWASGQGFPDIPASAPTADADGDGMANYLEYALGGNPVVASTSDLPTASITTVGSDRYLTLRTTKNPSATDIVYTVEASSDLTAWSSSGLVILSDTPTQRIVRDSQPIGSGARFLRLNIGEYTATPSP